MLSGVIFWVYNFEQKYCTVHVHILCCTELVTGVYVALKVQGQRAEDLRYIVLYCTVLYCTLYMCIWGPESTKATC